MNEPAEAPRNDPPAAPRGPVRAVLDLFSSVKLGIWLLVLLFIYSSIGSAGIVYLDDDPAAIMKKFKRAVTDSESEVRFDRATKPGVSNLLEILAACTGRTPDAVAADYSQYGPLKNDTGEAVVAVLSPIQERYRELLADRAELARLLRVGADKARAVASRTLERAYTNIGILPPA